MSALFKNKNPCALLFIFFLLVFADRVFVLARDDVDLSDASNVAVDDLLFASNKDELPLDLQKEGSIDYTKNGNITLTLSKDVDKKVCIPLVARKSSSNLSFRASLDNCEIEKGQERKWNLSYLGEGGKQVELSIIWEILNFILANGSNIAYIGTSTKLEVDVIFNKSQAFVTEKDGIPKEGVGMLNLTDPVDMQANFSLSISPLDSKCSITLEFDNEKFGLLKPVVTTPMPTTPEVYESTIDTAPIAEESTTGTAPELDESAISTQEPSGGTNPLWYILAGVALLIVCLIGIGIGVYFFMKRRRDKSKDPEKDSALPVDDSKPAIGASSFSTSMTPIKTSDTPSIDSKVDRASEVKSTDDKSKEKEGAKIAEAAAVGKKSKEEGKIISKKVLVEEDKKKSSKPGNAGEGKPGPKGKKVYVPLIDMDNSLKSKSKQKTPGTDYENYK